MQKFFFVSLWVLIFASAASGKNRQDVPSAPLPAIVINASKIFLTNGGGSNLAYDSFYSEMKQWGRYEIVGSPQEADLIIELAYRVEQNGTRVWSSTNPYYGTTQVHSAQIEDPQLALTIYDAKTKNSLWSEVDHRRLARREKNREKEIINSAARLVQDLKARVGIAGSIAPTEPKNGTSVVESPRPPIMNNPVRVEGSSSKTDSNGNTDGTASVTSNPDGAVLFIDSIGRGQAPIIVKISPGKHSFQLVMAGYKDWISEVEVRSGSIVNVSASLEK
ncbi:MAG: PEGA domain-containing protein [Acidobacteriota bacterium]|nr:PEGA domain-containing protein [Acidobacteriota bacterium]